MGKESGFLYLTRKGWEHYREQLRAAYLGSNMRHGSWDDFVIAAEGHLLAVEKAAEKFLKELDAKRAEIELLLDRGMLSPRKD